MERAWQKQKLTEVVEKLTKENNKLEFHQKV